MKGVFSMKFTEGYWLRSERANSYFATEAFTVDQIPGGMHIVAAVGKINHRGDTLNIPTITIEFIACGPETISVKAWHYEGYDTHLPEFEKKESVYTDITLDITEEEVFLDTGVLKVRVTSMNHI